MQFIIFIDFIHFSFIYYNRCDNFSRSNEIFWTIATKFANDRKVSGLGKENDKFNTFWSIETNLLAVPGEPAKNAVGDG